ncbi:hypothetical protein IY145_13225 [Methylosinus sp. H3A]|uniref:hypothetical protein n=1 Tax=Methylosinus sp. H3A TaxID=2785786 RepID=UPI0018C2AE12|nr:hypothetical protein [Methylosinus sp. H3A]MBG0810335.1 hypothetical protein [Methylosinus sp. H3A]
MEYAQGEIGGNMLSYWAYILIGNNDTGKTSFQKHLVSDLCNLQYQRLPRNFLTDITHPRMPRGVATLSTMNRSYQEKIVDYGDVASFFQSHFKEADICILSSHAHTPSIDHVRDMIRELRRRAYNVAAVFFSNGYNNEAAEISLLDWDERLWLDNPPLEQEAAIQSQIARLANEFAHLLIARATIL